MGAFTRILDKEKGGSIYPENGFLGLFKVVLARVEWVTGTLDRGDNVICSLSMILVKTVPRKAVHPLRFALYNRRKFSDRSLGTILNI
jgi:hypothetical protein